MSSTRMRSMILAVVASAALLVGAASASAATETVSADGDSGWDFNPDPVNETPYEFSTEYESIGSGSLHVLPISAVPAKKFIAAKELGTPVSDLTSLSFDFMIDPEGTVGATTYKQFYANVYVNLPSSSTFYDCRFDYVATSGSDSSFTTVTITPSTVPTAKGDRADAFTCPATLGAMPTGSTIRAFTLNVGDTSANDTGVGGYLDNVVVSQTGGSTTYDFEATPASKDDCKKGGWEAFGFKNQGECVSSVAANQE